MSTSETDCLKDTVGVLIDAIGDNDNAVSNVVIKSLTKIANVYPNEVIEIFCEFYQNKVKISTTQLGNIVKVLEQTCVNQIKKLDAKVASDLVNAMLRAMMDNPSHEPLVQMGASSVLVAISHEHLDLVLRSLINQLTPASVPHYTVAHTLGTLAAVNTHELVPHIKEILGKMLPVLTLVKQDSIKQSFAYAFGHFAVAVAEQIGDNVQSGDITSIKENFVTEFSIVFDVLYNQWLPSHEPKVSESVLEALGPITRLIPERQFNETVNKFVLSLLSLYRKPMINCYYISQCISYLVAPSSLNPKLNLNENVIYSINHILFNLVLLEPDYDQPQSVKNHFEVLRVFDHMASQFPDQTIENLLHLCKHNQEKERMKSVVILTHLTTSSHVFVENFASKFIALLKVMIMMEQGIKMKKLLVKAIVGLVYRNCITNTEDFTMVEFIIKHCGVEIPNASKTDVLDLRDTCKSSMVLMCNTVTSVRSQLLTLLLHALTLEELTPSMSTVSQCLTSLLQNNSEDDDKSDAVVDLKISPDLVFVRCIMHVADPDEKERNKNLLVFLEEYAGDVHKNLKTLWTVEIQRLLKFVEKNESREEWHRMLLDLLVSAVEQVNNNKWVEIIATLISQQILIKKNQPMIKGVSLQYLAVLSCHISNAAAVETILKIIVLALRAIPMDSVYYVSGAVGIASRQHGEFIQNELDVIYKENEAKRGNKLLNFLSSRSSKNELELGVVKYAIITCYGCVARECLDPHVLARLGENVTSILYDILKAGPSYDLCRASITTLYEISKALHPAAHHNVGLRNRWQLLNAVLEQIYNSNLERRNVELYPIIVKASKGLTKLQKGILPEERNTILRVFFNSIFGELSSFKKKYELEGNDHKNDLLAKTLNDSLNLLHDLIKELIIQSTCLSTIDDIVGLLVEWIRHENDEIRTAATLILQVVFDAYIKNVKLNYETPSKFGQMGYLLGLVVPGVADTNFPVRLTTIDCVKIIIQIQDLYEGHITEADDEYIVGLTQLQNNILTNDLGMIADYCSKLCATITPKIPHLHTMQFIESLLEGYDDQENRGVGSSAVLDEFFVIKGQELFQNVERIVEVILGTMDRVNDDARGRLLKPLLSLTRNHSNAVTAVLLGQKIPLSSSVITCWRYLARDENISESIVDNFLRLMTSIELYEDPYHITENRIAALQPLTLISALGEMLQEPAMRPICIAKFADLFTVLYTTLACYIDAVAPAYSVPANKGHERFGIIPNREAIKLSPAKITINTFNAFLERSDCDKVRDACSIWLSGQYTEGGASELAALAGGALCRAAAAHLPRLAARLANAARHPLPPPRRAAHALLAELLHYRCNDNPVVMETALATLSAGWRDAAPGVRAACLRGAAHIVHLNAPQRAAALPNALAALSEGIDAPYTQSQVDNVPLAAMQGLTRLLADAELDRAAQREITAVAQKVRPYMSSSCAVTRAAAVRVFGLAARAAAAREALADQAVACLPTLLLHLNDGDADVVRASKFTLRIVFGLLETPRTSAFVQTHLVDEGRLHVEEFLRALLRTLADERADTLPGVARHAARHLHAPADLRHPALLIGILYEELNRVRDATDEVEKEVTSSTRVRLTQLVRSGDVAARPAAAAALAALCLYECA
ncbi:maestro heat-like repeat-containing protein family member 1 [Aricia agestis]|uniref:maestro heat-like repeat-containing protein family member 1 n=1 Tax=Aricia agestis TaxID=91739 RepID=UPI001C204575|nr:maestro heat-like repeat-containing protein family member 1 [Aricia agestis]